MTQIRKFRQQTVPPWRRAVLKVGSSLLASEGGGLSTRYALGLAQFISACHASGREIVLVSSGAVAAGRMMLKDYSSEDTSNAARQAMAALGQTQTSMGSIRPIRAAIRMPSRLMKCTSSPARS
jgi:glutamate 5-kinase